MVERNRSFRVFGRSLRFWRRVGSLMLVAAVVLLAGLARTDDRWPYRNTLQYHLLRALIGLTDGALPAAA